MHVALHLIHLDRFRMDNKHNKHKHAPYTNQVGWWLVWWFLPHFQEVVLRLPTLWQVLREGQTESIHCLLCIELLDWVCSKLCHENKQKISNNRITIYIINELIWSAVVSRISLIKCLPTPDTSTQEWGGLEEAAMAWERALVVSTRLENKSFL